MSVLAHENEEELPAWSFPTADGDWISLPSDWPDRVTREWAWGGATGAGVRVCVLDSGIELDHPLVGTVQRSVAVSKDGERDHDQRRHGRRSLRARDCVRGNHPLARARVRARRACGCSAPAIPAAAPVLLAGLEWAIEQGFDVINMSLSTTKQQYVDRLHELADSAYFKRTLLIASAHNMPVESFPWRFAAVISVGSHEAPDPFVVYANPRPPVEFFARGLNVEIAWLGGATINATGNSFATPHVAGLCALILSKHPELTPFQVKSVLHLTAMNVGGGA